jgi:peroxiredoxin family protein
VEADPRKRVAIFLHSGDYDRLHQGAAIAAAATASGRTVQLFFFWWALEALLSNALGEPRFEGANPVVQAAEDAFDKGYPTAQALLSSARATGHCYVYACSASAGVLGRRPDEVASRVDQVVGWTAILALTAGVTDRFYL